MADINTVTRELFIRSVENEVFLQLALLAILKEHNQVSFRGGSKIQKPVRMAKGTALTQSYTVNDPLAGGRLNVLEKPEFTIKYNQTPIEYTVEDVVLNDGGPDTAPISSIETAVETSQEGLREALAAMIYATSSPDGGADFQSLCHAFDHSKTYGTITCTNTVKNWWCGASLAGTFVDRATNYSATIANLRTGINKVKRHVKPNSKLYAVCGEEIFDKFRSQVEARHIYTRDGSLLAKYGFTTMIIDDVEFVKDSWLSENDRTTDFLLVNPDTIELWISPKRSFNVTPFTWQADRAGGKDSYLARIMLAGNLVCWKPNANLWLSNMT